MTQLQSIFEKQKEYFLSDATKSYEWRIHQLDQLGKMLSENQKDFGIALAADFKTAWFEQNFEIYGALGSIAETRASLEGWMRPKEVRLSKAMTESGHKGIIFREPYGVSLVIAPFNAPLILLVEPLIAALAAGNCVMVKPSEAAPATAALFESLIARYFEPEAVAMVRGNREAVTELLSLPFDFIFFTGSTKVGKVVMRAAAEHLTPMVLELGGQNAAIVDETANLADAAEKLVWGAMAYGGQWCVSPGYVYVHESVAESFVACCKAALLKLYGPDPKVSPDYSRLISENDVERIVALLDPGKVVAGGKHDKAARYLAPTVVFPATWDDAVMQEEIFGPVLPILPYSDLANVVQIIKRKPKGLAGYVFSRDQKTIDYLLSSLSFGGGAVNQTILQCFISAMPFGGVGNSGLGRYYGEYGFDTLSHSKSILISDADVTIEEVLPPYSQEKAIGLGHWFAPNE